LHTPALTVGILRVPHLALSGFLNRDRSDLPVRSADEPHEEEENMDMKTLVVGQNVWMQSGIYARQGKVVNIRGGFIEVEPLSNEGTAGLRCHIRFGINGKACDSSDIYEGNLWGKDHIPGTHEFGPWELVDNI
jgi:hypothetical protein